MGAPRNSQGADASRRTQAAPTLLMLTPSTEAEAALRLRQLLPARANPPPPMTYQDLHAAKGTPPAARAALAAAQSMSSWRAVAVAFQSADIGHRLAATVSEWRSYVATCEADGAEPLPLSIVSVLAWWHHRVVGNRLKSSALPSVTSRLLSHAALLGAPASATLTDTIWYELSRFRAAFPCEVAPAAPPLGDAGDGHLSLALAFAETRANSSLLYRVLHTLLVVSQALYCRPTALLDGHLRRDHILSVPASPVAPGGLVLRLLLPKREKGKVDMRRDSFPIPTGPATRALLALLGALGLLADDAQADAIVFPDIDPRRDRIRGPAMSVERATDLLRRHVFIPAGLPAGGRLTLRSIRSGASTDAAARGVSTLDRLAQGGWASEAGAKTYLDRGIVMLAGPTPRPS